MLGTNFLTYTDSNKDIFNRTKFNSDSSSAFTSSTLCSIPEP